MTMDVICSCGYELESRTGHVPNKGQLFSNIDRNALFEQLDVFQGYLAALEQGTAPAWRQQHGLQGNASHAEVLQHLVDAALTASTVYECPRCQSLLVIEPTCQRQQHYTRHHYDQSDRMPL